MKLPSLWGGLQDVFSDPFRGFRREIQEIENMLRRVGRRLPSVLPVGAGAPSIDVAETKDALEVTVELPGVDEKNIKVTLEGNQLVISGEKKEEATRDEKDWHVEERRYGSFYRSMSLPFSPGEKAVEAHLDKGVLHVKVKKPVEVAAQSAKTIEIKPGAPPTAAGVMLSNLRSGLLACHSSGRPPESVVTRTTRRMRAARGAAPLNALPDHPSTSASSLTGLAGSPRSDFRGRSSGRAASRTRRNTQPIDWVRK